MTKKRVVVAASMPVVIMLVLVIVLLVLALTGCTIGKATNIVDTKLTLGTPNGSQCYLLEVDKKNGAGEDTTEHFYCATKEEYDRNTVGKKWVDATGKLKK